jgi:hypothetical protein
MNASMANIKPSNSVVNDITRSLLHRNTASGYKRSWKGRLLKSDKKMSSITSSAVSFLADYAII